VNKQNISNGFTKLEAILIGLILLFIVGFFASKYSNLFISKENLLAKRYNELTSLLSSNDYAEAYGYFSAETKREYTLNEYIKSQKGTKESSTKQDVTVNNIIVENNTGYIDRTISICEDDNCTNNKIIRGYKQWVFENGNWFYDAEEPTCIRKEMYDMPEEFIRAMSLFKQRYSDKFGKGDDSIFNCLDVQYTQLNNAEGIFTFDVNKSSMDRLSIYVDNSYKVKDDVLTAFLLSHEINHAGNYLRTLNTGEEFSCYDLETGAFQTQYMFLGSLNSEEQDSIVGRIATTNFGNNNPLLLINTFLNFTGNATHFCGSGPSDCFNKKIIDQITKMVKSNPYYQKQCGFDK